MASALDATPDLGLFGPDSVAWRLHRHPAMLIGGLRALMIQALHPLAMAGVANHSNYRHDVWGRFNRSANYVTLTVFGDTPAAEAAGRKVRAVHRSIHGIDGITGKPYAAEDPDLLLWVHACLVDSFIAAYRAYVGPLSERDADRYLGEMVRQAELAATPAEIVPRTERDLRAYLESVEPQLVLTPAAREAFEILLDPPDPPWHWPVAIRAAIAILPERHRARYGVGVSRLTAAALRPLVWTGSGLLPVILGPPPVIAEARRRAAGD
ncbi:MAG TPA: oxygenase MpaB family protein [Candidatus Dormibacteraeota bacterium]